MRELRKAGAYAALLGTGMAGSIVLSFTRPVVRVQWPQVQEGVVARRVAAQRLGGPEYALIYVGSSECAYSTSDRTREAVRQAVGILEEEYRDGGVRYTTAGVSLDWDTGAGERHLARVWQFDEESAGRFWLNSNLMNYARMPNGAQAGTPQLILVRRVVVVPERSGVAYEIKDERVLVAAVGIQEVVTFPNKLRAILAALAKGGTR